MLLVSCGLASGDAADEPTTLTYWSWISGSEELVDAFNATHDDIHVTFEPVPAGTAGGYSKMFNAVRAGKAPDVVTVEFPNLPGFVTQNVVQPLEPYGAGALESQYPAWTWQQVALGGRVHAVPLNVGPAVMFYRKDLFTEYGLTPPATWPEFRETAERLRAGHPEAALTNLTVNDGSLLAALAWQAGASWFDTATGTWRVDATDEASSRVARYWESLVADDLVTLDPTFAEEHITELQRGRSLTLLAAPWTAANIQRFLPDLEGAWGVAPMPVWPGQDPATTGNYGGSALAIPEGAPHAAEAMEFIRWAATSPEAMAAVAPVSTSYPASTRLTEAWGPAIEEANPYVRGMNLPEVSAAAAAAVDPSWEWGPDMTEAQARLVDELTASADQPGGIQAALARWEAGSVDQLRLRGFDVHDGDRDGDHDGDQD